MTNPLDTFRAAHPYDGHDPTRYITNAALPLSDLRWLARPFNPSVRGATVSALYGADGQGLDPYDAWPVVLLWCLRLNRHLVPIDTLDVRLYEWRLDAEDAAGERFHWLPSFPEHTP